jgi:hypothetical protein
MTDLTRAASRDSHSIIRSWGRYYHRRRDELLPSQVTQVYITEVSPLCLPQGLLQQLRMEPVPGL